MSIINRRFTKQSWFKACGGLNAVVATLVLTTLSVGSSEAAQFNRTRGAASSVHAQSLPTRNPAVRAVDSMSRLMRLMRLNSGGRNGAQNTKSGWLHPAGKSVVWFSLLGSAGPGSGGVNSYDADGNLTGSLTGLDSPFGVAVDKSGNVYVANTFAHQVLIYQSGAIVPTLTLDDPGFLPFSVAVNEVDGSVAVGNLCQGDPVNFCSGTGNTLIYKKGATKPSLTLNGVGRVLSVAYDQSGKVWADGYTTFDGSTSIIGYYDNHGGPFHVFSIKPLVFSGTIGFDAFGNLDVLDGAGGVSRNGQNTCAIESIYKPGNPSPLRILTLGGCLSDVVSTTALDKASNDLWALNQYHANLELGLVYTYPAGKNYIRKTIVFPGNDQPYGVAVKP